MRANNITNDSHKPNAWIWVHGSYASCDLFLYFDLFIIPYLSNLMPMCTSTIFLNQKNI